MSISANKFNDEQRFKKRVFAVCLSLAVCFAALVIVLQSALDASPPETSILSFGAASTTGTMILMIPIIVAWGFSAYLRCSDKVIKRHLRAIAALLAFWLFVVLIKYPANNDLLVSMLWYCFYIPMNLLPTLCLFCAARAATFDSKRYAASAKRIILLIDACFIVLILTNNLHHAVFAFDFADPAWESNYQYRWGYNLDAAWFFIQYTAFFIMLFPAAHKQKRNALFPVLVIACLGLVYSLLYIFRHEFASGSNISLVYVFLTLIALELLLDFRVFPSYPWYNEIFLHLPFDLKIFNSQNKLVHQTWCAHDLQSAVVESLDQAPSEKGQLTIFKISSAPNIIFKQYHVSGGSALLSEEITSINSQRSLLEEKQESLRQSNLLLTYRRPLSVYAYQLEQEKRLFNEISSTLKDKTQLIQDILDTLPEGADEASVQKRKEALSQVKLLVAYCKRKGNLVLLQKTDPDFNRERLQLVFNETASDLRSLGIDCAALVEISRSLPAQTVSVLYDCLYDFSALAFISKEPVLMFFVQELSSESIELRTILQAQSIPAPQSQQGLLTTLKSNLEQHAKTFSLRQDSETVTLSALFEAGDA